MASLRLFPPQFLIVLNPDVLQERDARSMVLLCMAHNSSIVGQTKATINRNLPRQAGEQDGEVSE